MTEGSGIFSQSGLNEDEAKEVQGYVMQYFAIFLFFAIAAHILMWFYKPWINPSEMGMLQPITESAKAFLV